MDTDNPQPALFRPQQQQPRPSVEAVNQFSSLAGRLGLLEERISEMQKHLQFSDHSLLTTFKKLSIEIKAINSDITELKNELDELSEKLSAVLRESQGLAKREDVEVLKRYLNLWEPVNFVTQKEVERIVDDALEKRKHEQ